MSVNIDIHSATTANLLAPFVSRNIEPIMNDSNNCKLCTEIVIIYACVSYLYIMFMFSVLHVLVLSLALYM